VSLVEIEQVHKEFAQPGGPVRALDGITLAIDRGEFLAVKGESGSGKSTLLSLVGALDAPTRGVIRIEGVDLAGLSPGRRAALRLRDVGYVFQDFLLVGHLTALENVKLPLYFAGAKEAGERARSLLAGVGLEGRLGHKPADLSRGEMQRVALARALANRPALLVADEPTANLDQRNADGIWDLFRDLNAREGVTIVVATHSDTLARRARRIVHLAEGRLVADERL